MCNKILLPRPTAANSQHTPGAGLSVGERRQHQVVDSVGASFGVKSYSILQVSRRVFIDSNFLNLIEKIPKITWYETQLYIIPNSHNSINYQHQPFYSPYSHSYPRHRSHYRLPRFKTDILVSINTPLRSELNIETLSPLSDPVAKEDRIHVLQSQLADRYGDDQSETINILLGITKSLRIHNTGLFVI